MEQQLLTICELLVRGYSRAEVQAELGVAGEVDFLEVYATALLKIADALEQDPEAQRQLGLARLNMLYAKSLAQSDHGQCLAIQKEINLLLSLRREPAPSPLPDLTQGYSPTNGRPHAKTNRTKKTAGNLPARPSRP
jgi:hypothetical protein